MKAEAWVALIVGIATVAVALAAIWLGPRYALREQRKLDEARQRHNEKMEIFKTLMSFRGIKLAPAFVQALNLIDVVFASESERTIRSAWHELQDHYNDWGAKSLEQRQIDGRTNSDKAEELLSDLLVRMGASLGFPFDKVYIKKGWYYPEGLGDIEQEQHALRKGLLRLLAGQSRLPVAVFEQTFEDLAGKE